ELYTLSLHDALPIWPTGLKRGTTFAEITTAVADAIRAEFTEPVSVLGISTGGSIAQQLAAEHPDVVDRLVLISTGCRLAGHAARSEERRVGNAGRRG